MKVFLSYADEDRVFAKDLASRLSKAGYEVWDPDREVLPGDNWPQKIGEALERAEAMIVVLSPEAVASKWIRREIEYALGSSNYAGRLIPILLRPTEEIPWILQKLKPLHVGKDRAEVGRRIVDLLRRTPTAHEG
jgi:hypothetical protein